MSDGAKGLKTMRARAIRDLSQLSDADLFVSVAEGLSLIVTNARRLYNDAKNLADLKRFHGSMVLCTIAEEEASKFLILIDAIRCPRDPAHRFSSQLARFNDHLAKGLYCRAYCMRPSTLGQLQEHLDNEREEFYLDGPNNVDWIFRNDVIQRREELLYVDYIDTGDNHCWTEPSGVGNEVFGSLYTGIEPRSLQMVNALFESGISNATALSTVAEVWRSVAMRRDLSWMELRTLNRQTLENLEQRGLLCSQPEKIYAEVINAWQFPLYDLDLRLIPVDKNVLRQRQENWSLDW